MGSIETTDAEKLDRRLQWRARRHLRQEQLREELAIHAADVRAGRFRTIAKDKPQPARPWDGVKDSQITPLQ